MRSARLHNMFNTMGLIALFTVLMLSAVWAGLVLAGHNEYAMVPMFVIFAQYLWQVHKEYRKLKMIVDEVDEILEPDKGYSDVRVPQVFKEKSYEH